MAIIEHWIGGRLVGGDRRSPVFNPATGSQQHEVVLASPSDVDAAVSAAQTAFTEWSQASLSKRTKILFNFR